ncbi:MAG: hypothetical protein Q9208_007962 [Pyrenodesmia sp. 3 TL-2023]
MSRKNRVTSVCREDVLTSRGANPRTGLITPFISTGNSEDGDDNDYVRLRRVQDEADLTVGADERWRQDELGWSLVGRTRDPDSNTTTDCFSSAVAAGRAQEQLDEPESWGPALIGGVPSRTTVRQHVSAAQSNAPGAPESIIKDQASCPNPRSPLHSSQAPACLFRIPRKEVGNNRSASSSPIASPHRHAHPSVVRNGHKAVLTNNALASGLPNNQHQDHLAAPCPGRSSHCNQAEVPSHQVPYPPDFFSSRVDSLSTSIDPSPKARYRRPTQLLPFRQRVHTSNKGNTNVENADRYPSVSEDVVLEQRPHFKRVKATTAVPMIRVSRHVEKTESGRSGASPAPYQAREVSAQKEDSVSDTTAGPSNSHQVKGIVDAARKDFINMEAFEPHPLSKHSNPRDILKTDPSVQKVQATGSSSRASSTGDRLCINYHAQAKSLISGQKTPSNGVGAYKEEQANCEPRSVRRNSAGTAVKVQESFVTFAGDICAIVDWEGLLSHLATVLKHAALTWRQMPWAVRTLRSQNAEVWDYLLAVRHVAMTLLYLAMLLGVLGGALKILKLLVELGNCLWYPMGLVLTMVRWILLH